MTSVAVLTNPRPSFSIKALREKSPIKSVGSVEQLPLILCGVCCQISAHYCSNPFEVFSSIFIFSAESCIYHIIYGCTEISSARFSFSLVYNTRYIGTYISSSTYYIAGCAIHGTYTHPLRT